MNNKMKNLLTIAGTALGLILAYELINNMQVKTGNVSTVFGSNKPLPTANYPVPTYINTGGQNNADKVAMWGAIGSVGSAAVAGLFGSTGDENGGN